MRHPQTWAKGERASFPRRCWMILTVRRIYTTMIVGRGTLNLGDLIVSGDSYCLARRIITADGRVVKAAHPSDVVQVYGWRSMPSPGHIFICAPSDCDEVFFAIFIFGPATYPAGQRYLKRAREARQHPAASDGDRPAKHLPHGPRPSPRKGRYNRQTAVQEKQSSAAEDRQSPRLCILIKGGLPGWEGSQEVSPC